MLTLKDAREPIAIIGIGCRFPGDANDPESFWKLLVSGVDAITEIPQDRWNIDEHYHPVAGMPGKTYSRWGGFLKGIEQFDPEFFGISPREAAHMDPQQRLILEVAWEALEDGGQVIERLAGTSTGVFIGISHPDYAQIQSSYKDRVSVDAHTATGGALCIAANRVSYCLNLRGPSMAVDTACSSSLVATHLACQSLWNGECGLALAGGVNVIISSRPFIAFCAASMLSPDGRCKAFDAAANGFVRAEGAGVVVLKPLTRALADGDPVYAVIAGSAVNQDGRTTGIAMPSQSAQEELIREACLQAGISPADVDYMEAHGTGTAVGDPIEAMAIGNVLCSGRLKEKYCVIGSAKTNIGHLEAAAGIAGVIKVALSLKHRMIPPNLHFNTPNPAIPFDELQLRVPTALEVWPKASRPGIAGVNSFGFGGANAHLVIVEYPLRDDLSSRDKEDPPQATVLPVSAHTLQALEARVRSYRDFLDGNGDQRAALTDFCYTASVRRSDLDHRLLLVAHSKKEMREHLETFLAGERRAGMFTGRRIHGQPPKLAFVFSGQGPQWWGMGRDLLRTEDVFRKTMEECDRLLSEHADWSLLRELDRDEVSSRLHETAIAQPAIFALQVALAALWRSWGVEPEAIVGHSVGEIAAACTAGILPLENAVRVIFYRAKHMDFSGAKGKMLAVALPLAEATRAITGYEDRISIAAINSASSITLSGEDTALQRVNQSLLEQGIFCRFLRVEYAFHSPRMDPVKQRFLDSLNDLQPNTCLIPFISTVTGKAMDGGQCDKEYWWRNIREKVRFAEAMDCLFESGCNTFLELSPHPVLSGSISECLVQRGRKGTVLPSLRRNEEERAVMLGSLGALYTLGHPVEWRKLWPDRCRCVSLPRYPWQRQPYWHESEDSKEWRLGKKKHPLLGRSVKSADPMWENLIDKADLAYLDDHKVRNSVVFPGAAYIEMALGAAHETFGAGAYVLEEFQFQKVFFLPDREGSPTVQLVFHPADDSVAIYSKSSTAESSWDLNSVGYMRRETDLRLPAKIDVTAIRENLIDEISPEDCYSRFTAGGLQFGPSFRGIGRVWRRDGEALAVVRLPTHLESKNYVFHPGLLDSCLQVLFSALPQNNGDTSKILRLPVRVERARLFAAPGPQVWSHVVLRRVTASLLEGDIRVYDDDGHLVMDITGFKCAAVGEMRGDDSDDMEKWFYNLKWHSKPLPEQARSHRAAHYLPDPRQLVEPIKSEIHQYMSEIGWSERISKANASLDHLATGCMLQALSELGLELKSGDHVSVGSLIERLNLLPQYHRLLARFMNCLQQTSYLKSAGPDAWIVCQAPARQDPKDLWQRVLAEYPAYSAELSLIDRCGSNLSALLQGKMDALQVLFPKGAGINTAEHLYQDAPTFRFHNLMVQHAVARALADLPEGRIVRILETGAGTGGMASYVLSRLPGHCAEYVFSDVSKLFLDKAEQKFQEYPFVTYRLLDIETDPLQQGYEPHSFDLILASNVLHATKDLVASLRNVGKLLSSKGLLIILEAEKPSSADRAFSWIDLVFGTTTGWWKFADFDLRPDYPLVTRETWKRILQQAGFSDVEHVSLPSKVEHPGQLFLLARGAALQGNSEANGRQIALQSNRGEKGAWLIFADRHGIARKLADLLNSHGDSCVFVTYGENFYRRNETEYQISTSSSDMEQLIELVSEHCPPWRGAIHLWSLDAPLPRETSIESLQLIEDIGCHSVVRFVQAVEKLGKRDLSSRLVVVTSQAQPISKSVSIAQTPLVGLGRVIINELPNLHFKMVDLGRDISTAEIQSLFAELWTDDPEEEVALRDQERFVPRLERATQHRVAISKAKREGRTFRLEMPKSRVMDQMMWRKKNRNPPGAGQVEIEVYAASLNFRDVMKALGLYPTDGEEDMMLGDECSGRIVAVGEGVRELRTGDEVVALASGSFASHVTTPVELVIQKPRHLTFEEAANIPVAFLTAYYGLHHLARIEPGERVLIHSATGGVGLAAVQIARHAGAEIFATAGSPEKRGFLKALGIEHVMDSRTLAFADQVMEITGGRGVDIVLNALAGNAIAKGLSCLARYGRFVELGKRDIYQNSKLGLWSFRKNLSLFALDLSGFMIEKPAVMRSLFAELSAHINNRNFWALPHRVFPASRIIEAFRHMAQAKHIGKVVISMRNQVESIEPFEAETIAFAPEATYLISGGFGGFGLILAKWIVEHGGRNIVLMGRSGASSEEAEKTIEELKNRGARVAVAKADVSNSAEVAAVLAEIDKTRRPLKGIFHGAMVLHDNTLLQLSPEKFREVMTPKMDGTWNLHYHSLNQSLDFFVLFSSASSLIGNPGQGNYAAANSFLDAFAYYRRSLGLPAVSINWGYLGEVGYVARHPEISELLNRMGIEAISPKQAMDALATILQRKPVQIAAMRMDSRKVSKSLAKAAAQRLSSLIGKTDTDGPGAESGSRIKERLHEAKQDKRQDILENFIREQAARVLGISASNLDVDRSLNELGLDSLMAVELKNRIEGDLELSLPMGQLMQSPTIHGLSSVVLNQLMLPISASPAPALVRQQTPEQLLVKVDRLSDKEVDSLLRKMLGEETRQTETEMRE